MQKVVVIPYSLFTKWQNKQRESDKHDKRLAGCEIDLNKILKSGKSDDFKKIHYVEALRKFLQENRKIDDDTSDIRLDIEDKYQTNNDPHYSVLKNKITGNTLKRGQTLYKLLLSSPNISWDSSGLVTLNGSLIPGSNITDLIAGALDQNYSDQHLFSPGKDAFERFVRALKGANYKMTSTNILRRPAINQITRTPRPAINQITRTPGRSTPTTQQTTPPPAGAQGQLQAVNQTPVIQNTPPQRVSRKAAKNKTARSENIYQRQYKVRTRQKKQSGGSNLNPDKWLIYK